MDSFWKTVQTVQAENGPGYQAFPLFGGLHLLELGLCFALCLLLGSWYRSANAASRRRLLVLLTAFLLADEMAKYVVTITTGQWEWAFLPLHLCSLNIFICAAHTLRPSKTLREILYGLCLPGAALALFSPSWQALPLGSFMHLHSLTVHILLCLYPVLLLAGGFRPSISRIPTLLAFLGAVAVPVYGINRLLHTNFLFLNGAGSNGLTKALAVVFGEKTYLLGFPVVLLIVLTLLYLPWVALRQLAPAGQPEPAK